MIIVTGGAGFIGSNLLAGLERCGHCELAIIDRLGCENKWRNIAKRELAAIVAPEQTFAFLDAHALEIETIFHLGAISATTETDADALVANNASLTLRLWDWCSKRSARLIYASSAATYGDGSRGFADDASIEALARLQPLNPYGWSKHLTDRRIARLLFCNAPRPAQWVGLKFFNVYGPNEYHKGSQQSVVAHIYPRAAAGRSARLFRSHRPDYADGGQLRDFIWIDDVIDIMLYLYDHPQINGLYNVGTGGARSFSDLARAVYAALDRPVAIDFIDAPVAIRQKYQYFTQAEMASLRAAGYDRPMTCLEEGVRRYIQDYLAAADPYR